jgi:hypothetical protein
MLVTVTPLSEVVTVLAANEGTDNSRINVNAKISFFISSLPDN